MLIFAVAASAQPRTTVTMKGTAMDSMGSLIPNVMIKAKSTTGKSFEVKSGPDGGYQLELTPEIYKLTFSKPGFEEFVIMRYQIADQQKQMYLDVSLICIGCEEVSVPGKTGQPLEADHVQY